MSNDIMPDFWVIGEIIPEKLSRLRAQGVSLSSYWHLAYAEKKQEVLEHQKMWLNGNHPIQLHYNGNFKQFYRL